MNGYQNDSIVNSLDETKYLFHGCLKNDKIPLNKWIFYCKYNCENLNYGTLDFILHERRCFLFF